MKAEDILYAMGEIDDNTVREAHAAAPKPRRLRNIITAALAAALLLTLSLTVGAYVGAGDWFKSFFAESGDLTQAQQQYIDGNTLGIGQTAEHNGWSVTVESAITDGWNAYVKLNISAPEGVVLDKDSYYFDDYTFKSSNPQPTMGSRGCAWPLMDDGNAADNHITVLMQLYAEPLPDGPLPYADGYERTLVLTNVCTRQEDYPWEEITLTEGEWRFAFTLTADASELQLITEPVTLRGQRLMGDYFSVLTDSGRMTAMGVIFHYTFFEGDTPEAADFGPAVVRLTDGTTVGAWPKGGGIYGTADGWYTDGQCSYVFDSPIDLTEAAAIEFSDGTVIEVPN